MNKIDIEDELNQLKSSKLISDFVFNQDSSFTLTTLEQKMFIVNYSLNGYQYNESVFESFEQLLSNISSKYSEQFNQILFDKLLALSKEQVQE